MDDASQPLRIGALARAAGVNVETIRYYQRRKLLGQPDRPYGGQRAYPPEYAQRLRFIKRAQALGFTLEEIAELLTLDAGTGHVRARALAARRLAEIEAKLVDLSEMRAALRELLQRCEHTRGKVACPIISGLEPGSAPRRPPRRP